MCFFLGMIESAIVDHEPDGPLCDLLQMLLCALFNLQEEEADEYQELEKEKEENAKPSKLLHFLIVLTSPITNCSCGRFSFSYVCPRLNTNHYFQMRIRMMILMKN